MLGRDARGQIWRIALPGQERERICLIIGTLTEGAIVVPVLPEPSPFCVQLCEQDLRLNPAFAVCSVLTVLKFDSFLNRLGSAAAQTMDSVNRTIEKTLGLEASDVAPSYGQRFTRGQLWDLGDGKEGLIISSNEFHQRIPEDVIMVRFSYDDQRRIDNTPVLAIEETGLGFDIMVACESISTFSAKLPKDLLSEVSPSGMATVNGVLRRVLHLASP